MWFKRLEGQLSRDDLGFVHPRSSDCSQFLHQEVKYGGISHGGSWGHISHGFLSSFNFSGFINFYNGICLSRERGKKTSRKKRKAARVQERRDVMYGILDEEEKKTVVFMEQGLSMEEQKKICEEWKNGGVLCMATKYKPVAKKVRPVNEAMPQHINPPLQRPALSRDPYDTPLTMHPPEFKETAKVTSKRLEMVNFGPEGWLSEEEKKLILQVIVLREKAVAFDESERGCLKHEWGLPYVIPVVDHKPWQKRAIPIPKAIKEEYVELVRERLQTGLYEQSTSSYSSPVFCVLKQNGKLRVVHDLQELNKVTIKDAGLPPAPEEFVEAFAGRACYGLGDIMGGYDERELAHESRPLTTFETPLGRFQLTRLPQGATNSVAVYQAQMMWILQEELPQHVGIFIDDGGIKGPESRYNDEVLEENPGIRRFIWEYAVTLERVLFRIEEAGLTVSGKKFAACVPELEIVGHVVGYHGRTISEKKRNKILTWPVPKDSTEVRGFLGVCVYVRMFIESFAEISSPLRKLTRKDCEWLWDGVCQDAFEQLKEIVGKDIVLKAVVYGEGAGQLKLAVDSSYMAAGAVLTQEDENGMDRPALYESVTFTAVESRYSQLKLELCGVAKILKKLQTVLWGQHFELQVDAKSLVQMINSPSLPNAPMTRWVSFIQLFSFDLVHRPGKTFTMPDGLSRRPENEDSEDEAEEFDEELKFINAKGSLRCRVGNLEEARWEQVGFWRDMQEYLMDLKRPEDMSTEEFVALKRRSSGFFLEDNRLKKRAVPAPQLVISSIDGQEYVLEKLHEELGHKGVEETYRRVVMRFWWPGLKKKVKRWVASCEACQKRSSLTPKEIGHATGENTLFGRISMDAVHIKAGSYKYLLVARDDLSGWVEAVALTSLKASRSAEFLFDNWICRYGAIRMVTVDGGSEFRDELTAVVEKCGAKLRVVTPYYPQGAGMIERGHRPIKDALVKMCGESGAKWKQFLPLVLFADRISTKRTTGMSPYELLFGQKAVLPLDIEAATFLGIEWDEVKSTADLLHARAEQLLRREETLDEAYRKLMEVRNDGVRYWDHRMAHKLRKNPLIVGDLVLVYNASLESQWGKLLSNRWNGPYRLKEQLPMGSYVLEELDRTILKRRYAASHVKRFYARGTREEEVGSDEENESVAEDLTLEELG